MTDSTSDCHQAASIHSTACFVASSSLDEKHSFPAIDHNHTGSVSWAQRSCLAGRQLAACSSNSEMSSEAIGLVPAPDRNDASVHFEDLVMEGIMDLDGAGLSPKTRETSPKITGLHSPPDSNNAAKLDGSESELSDIEDMADDESSSNSNSGQPTAEPVNDIGEVLPDHWSGTVPVFKPTMHQFKDFKRFVWLSVPVFLQTFHALLTTSTIDGED